MDGVHLVGPHLLSGRQPALVRRALTALPAPGEQNGGVERLHNRTQHNKQLTVAVRRVQAVLTKGVLTADTVCHSQALQSGLQGLCVQSCGTRPASSELHFLSPLLLGEL